MSPIIKFFALSLSLVACNPARQQDLLDEVSGVEDYNTPNKRSGKFLHEWALSKDKTGNAEEMGNYFEGDIMLNRKARNGLIETSRKWKDGKIPYEINGNFSETGEKIRKHHILKTQNFRPATEESFKRRYRATAEEHLPEIYSARRGERFHFYRGRADRLLELSR